MLLRRLKIELANVSENMRAIVVILAFFSAMMGVVAIYVAKAPSFFTALLILVGLIACALMVPSAQVARDKERREAFDKQRAARKPAAA